MKLTLYGAVDLSTGVIDATGYEYPQTLTNGAIRDLVFEISRTAALAACVLCRTGIDATRIIAFGTPDDLYVAPACDECADTRRSSTTDDALSVASGVFFEVVQKSAPDGE